MFAKERFIKRDRIYNLRGSENFFFFFYKKRQEFKHYLCLVFILPRFLILFVLCTVTGLHVRNGSCKKCLKFKYNLVDMDQNKVFLDLKNP